MFLSRWPPNHTPAHVHDVQAREKGQGGADLLALSLLNKSGSFKQRSKKKYPPYFNQAESGSERVCIYIYTVY